MTNRGYFQLQQAVEVAETFAKYEVEFMFIGKSGAILLGYPSTDQNVELFPKKDAANGERIVKALRELDFEVNDEIAGKIVKGVDFIQLKTGPFDLDLVFAPDGIESFDEAKKRMLIIENFPVANIRDIVASKKASGREKDLLDLPLLEDFQEEFEKSRRGEPKTAYEIALEKLKEKNDFMKTKIKIAAIFTFSLFTLCFFLPKAEMQTKQVETAGQHFKNIKVLNDMPADQLGKVMNLMSTSLGVNCNYCHIGEDFAKDGKQEKETAREMITMTLNLNKNSFGGRTEISCNTCHQGHTHPQSAINFDAPVPEPRPKQPDVKPTIDAILAKYETAVGGKAALAKIISRTITASRVEPDGKTMEAEEILQKGDKTLTTTTYNSKEKGNYVVVESYDGTSVWKTGNKESIALKADEMEQIKRNAQIFTYADLKIVYPKMDYRFTDKIGGREVYLVLATTADNQRERLYFDSQTGFLVRRVASSPTVLGAFQYQTDYADYKDFGGVKIPTTIRYNVPNIAWTRKITDVKINAPVDDAKFSSGK